MRANTLPLIGAAAAGFLAALVILNSRSASAQFKPNGNGLPIVNNVPLGGAAPAPVQPIELVGLDSTHFVVATREPRLVQQIGREGSAQQMVVPVVTYYTVAEGRLAPVEHARVPTGFRLITIGDE